MAFMHDGMQGMQEPPPPRIVYSRSHAEDNIAMQMAMDASSAAQPPLHGHGLSSPGPAGSQPTLAPDPPVQQVVLARFYLLFDLPVVRSHVQQVVPLSRMHWSTAEQDRFFALWRREIIRHGGTLEPNLGDRAIG